MIRKYVIKFFKNVINPYIISHTAVNMYNDGKAILPNKFKYLWSRCSAGTTFNNYKCIWKMELNLRNTVQVQYKYTNYIFKYIGNNTTTAMSYDVSIF